MTSRSHLQVAIDQCGNGDNADSRNDLEQIFHGLVHPRRLSCPNRKTFYSEPATGLDSSMENHSQ